MRKILLIIFILNGPLSHCQDLKFAPILCAVFDSSQGKELLHQCSRSSPKNVSGFWMPTAGDISILENNFRSIYKISSNACCMYGEYFSDSLKNYGFQYLGVIIKGQKFIYIDAFHLAEDSFFRQEEYRSACDGGKWFWGVLFNEQKKKFSDLAFNSL